MGEWYKVMGVFMGGMMVSKLSWAMIWRMIWKMILVCMSVYLSIYRIIGFSDEEDGGRVYYLNIMEDFGVVSASYSGYIKKNLEKVNGDGSAKAIIIEVDTPGGSLSDAQKISKYIKESGVQTITYINDSAYSAGAIIGLSSDYTVITEGGKVGDVYPLVMGEGGEMSSIKDEKVYKKVLSGVKGMMKSLGERRKKRVLRDMEGGDERYDHLRGKKSIKHLEKILLAMVDPDLRLRVDREGYNLESGDLLTLTSEEAYRLGVVDGVYESVGDLLRGFNLEGYEFIELEAGLSDKILTLLTNPAVMSLLITLGTLGMVLELWTAGWGVSGTIGILALSLFFIGQFVGGNPEWTGLVLLIIGVVLIGLEIFVSPGFGILGLSGFGVLGLGFFIILKNTAYGGDGVSIGEALNWLSLSMIITGIVLFSGIKFLSSHKLFSGLTLMEGGVLSTINFKIKDKEIIGKKGKTKTVLRPSGIAEIDNQRYDAISLGEFIDQGERIEVISQERNQLIVRRLKE